MNCKIKKKNAINRVLVKCVSKACLAQTLSMEMAFIMLKNKEKVIFLFLQTGPSQIPKAILLCVFCVAMQCTIQDVPTPQGKIINLAQLH